MAIKALIVDDNGQNLYMLETVFKSNGYDVKTAQNGAEALETAKKDPPDIIVSDILMPVMDGFALCREWTKDRQLKKVPFVFYTATYTDPRDEKLALSLGAVRFIVKPMEPDEFIAVISGVLAEHKDGRLPKPAKTFEEETSYYRLYNEALIRKLEDKMVDMDDLNRKLRLDIEERKKVEALLTESENRFRTLFESAAEGILIADLETMRFQYANPAICAMLGYTAPELAGLSVSDIHPAKELPYVVKQFQAQSRGEIVLAPEIPCLRKNGTVFYADINTTKIIIDGKPYNAGFFTDITERRKAEEALRSSEARYRLLVENAPAGIYEFDYREGRIVSVNDVMCEYLGYTKEEILAMNPLDLLAGESREVHLQRLEQAQVGNIPAESFEYRIRRKDGGQIWGHVQVRYFFENGAPVRSTSVVHDITRLKDAEEKIQKAMTEAERANAEISKLNSDLKNLVEEKLSEIRDKDHAIILQSRLAVVGEMLHNIAHQWRQPLCAISLTVQNLFLKIEGGKAEPGYLIKTQANLLKMIDNLSKTIDDFRNFFRPDRQKEKFPVSDAVSQIRSVVGLSLKENNIALSFDLRDEAVIFGYPNEYRQVILNLIANAKDAFAEKAVPNPVITISHRVSGNLSVLTVKDNAGGISPDIMDRIFEPYFSTKPNGTGLGLYMSKNIIEKNMGGRLDFRNTGDGTEFSITVGTDAEAG